MFTVIENVSWNCIKILGSTISVPNSWMCETWSRLDELTLWDQMISFNFTWSRSDSYCRSKLASQRVAGGYTYWGALWSSCCCHGSAFQSSPTVEVAGKLQWWSILEQEILVRVSGVLEKWCQPSGCLSSCLERDRGVSKRALDERLGYQDSEDSLVKLKD